MDDDEEVVDFPPPDAGLEIADEPDPAVGETDADDAETPDDDEPEPDDDEPEPDDAAA